MSPTFTIAAPTSTAYAYDDNVGLHTCATGANYTMTFCPNGSGSTRRQRPGGNVHSPAATLTRLPRRTPPRCAWMTRRQHRDRKPDLGLYRERHRRAELDRKHERRRAGRLLQLRHGGSVLLDGFGNRQRFAGGSGSLRMAPRRRPGKQWYRAATTSSIPPTTQPIAWMCAATERPLEPSFRCIPATAATTSSGRSPSTSVYACASRVRT
jgi:hypothetical protein